MVYGLWFMAQELLMPRSFLIRMLVISTPNIKQVLYLNGDDISLPCHSEPQDKRRLLF